MPASDVADHRSAFGAVAVAVVALLAASNLPTPLYPVYQHLFRLSPLTVTLVFATYAATVMPALLIFGPLSDTVGRKPVLLFAIGGSAVAAGLFGAAASLAWLFAAQVIEGTAMGALQGSAVAALVESHPHGDRAGAARVGAVATVGGAAAGPLAAGLLAEYGPFGRRLPFLVAAALLVMVFAVVWRSFPHDGGGRTGTWRPRVPTVPAAIRRRFFVAEASAFLAWALAALFLSLIPSYAVALLGLRNLAVTGGLAALMLGSSAVVQLRGGPVHETGHTVGICLVAAACGSLILAAHVRSLSPLLLAAVLAGVALGLTFQGALGAVSADAPSDRKGDILATFYLFVYLGTAIPVVGVGVAALSGGLLNAVELFAYCIGGSCVVLAALVLLERRAREHR